jgi:hypothetical protein
MPDGLGLHRYALPHAPSGPSALYYPHIHFRSRRWLRMALLYYESISRIVPPGLDPEMPQTHYDRMQMRGILDDVSELRALGFIRDEAPGEALPAVTNEFFDFYASNLTDPEKRAALIPALSRRRAYTIHPAKIDLALLEVLHQADHAHRKVGDPYSDWDIEPIVGAFYMLFLAARMARNRPLISDNSIYQSLLFRQPDPDAATRNAPDGKFRLATAVIESVIPGDLEEVPLDKLLRLRTESVEDRRRFQDRMAEFGKDIDSAKIEEEFRENVDRIGRKVRDEVAITRNKLHSLNIATASGLFSLSVPSWATATWGLEVAAPIVIAGLGAVALSAAWLRYRFERQIAQTNPYNYLLNLSGLVTAQSLAKDIVTLNLQAPDDDDDDRVFAY